MMKYVGNHHKSFSNPFYAFTVALMQCLGGIGAEVFCIIFLCSLTDPILILIRFVAFASIGKVDDFYASALSPDHKMKKDSSDIMITNRRSMIEKSDEKMPCSIKISRAIYKTLRIFYASFVFYFLPYMALFVPQFLVSEINTTAAA